ncbi:MAG: integrase arm-type DNA-binding domain-containing protein [Pseudomonadota bacterium]
MALTDKQIRALKPSERPFKRADAKGLYIEVMPTGSKLWRFKFRIAGKEKRLALGAYPEVSLSEARKRRDSHRSTLESGKDPALERKRQKIAAKISAGDSFALIAEEYIAKMEKEARADSTLVKARWFLSLLRSEIGHLPVSEVDPQLLHAALKRHENKGNFETAKKTRSFASRVFRYAVATGRAKSDPAALLKGALIAPKVEHFAAILEPGKLGELLRSIEDYSGAPATRYALLIAPHVFVRPGELRMADWAEFDLDSAVWTIPGSRMKARRPHTVPLSKQVQGLLGELKGITGPDGYVFPALHTSKRPLSENTLNASFRRMGYSKEEVTAHGLRSTASTLLNESGKWNPDAIERALSHGDSDAVRGSYARGQYWEERVAMAQWWSDYLDRLKTGGEVVAIRPESAA